VDSNPNPIAQKKSTMDGIIREKFGDRVDDRKISEILSDVKAELRRVDLLYGNMAVDDKKLIVDTMSGNNGGGVGFVHFDVEGKDYVFQINRDYMSTFKWTHSPHVIHKRASNPQGNRIDDLACYLAKRTPKSLLSEPIIIKGYNISLLENVNDKVITLEPEENRIIESAKEKFGSHASKFDPEIVDRLYTLALYQEVMTAIYREENNMDRRIIVPGNVPTNLSLNLLGNRFENGLSRTKGFYEHIIPGLNSMLPSYVDNVAELDSIELNSPDTIGHYDAKTENWKKRSLLDHGCVKLGKIYDDLARTFMDRPDIVADQQGFRAYLDLFTQIRRNMNSDYAEPDNYHRLATNQTKANAIRNAGWSLLSDRRIQDFDNFWKTAMYITRHK
jgi:hypothetical protein